MKAMTKLVGPLLGISLLAGCATPPPKAIILPQKDNNNFYAASSSNDYQAAMDSAIKKAKEYCDTMQRNMVIVGQSDKPGSGESDTVKMTNTVASATVKIMTLGIVPSDFGSKDAHQVTVTFRCDEKK